MSKSVAIVNDSRKIPIMIVNNTNKTFHLKRGCPIARVENIHSQNIARINEVTKSRYQQQSTKKPNKGEKQNSSTEINAHVEYMPYIRYLVAENTN